MTNEQIKKHIIWFAYYNLWKGYRTLKKVRKDPTYWITVQNRNIKEFVEYAYTIPFYRKRFDECGLKPSDIKTREDFKKLPPLTKQEYREWILEETKDKSKFSGWMYRQTTGSSGTPLDLYSLPTDRAAEIANLMRCALLQQKGHNPIFGRVFSTMTPKPPVKKKFSFCYDGKMSSIAKPEELVAGYNEARPDFYYGNKTAVLLIAQYALEHGIKLHKPKCVGSISELLDDNARKICCEAYGDDVVFDIYGCAETGNFAVDRPCEPGKHTIWNDTHVVNLYNQEKSDKVDNVYTGQLMLTSLIHRGFPLINYIVGDNVELTIEDGVPYITKIIGRSNDVIKNADGTSFKWMHVNRIMFGITEITQFRIVQKTLTDLNLILAAQGLSDERKQEIENTINTKALEIFGSDMATTGKNIHFEWCDIIPPDPSGKVRILISEI